MNTTRSASRTRAGLVAPITVAAVAGCFALLTLVHAHDVKWLGMDPALRMLLAGLGIFAAVGTEMIVLRQKKLIGSGQLTEAVVDDVRSLSWANGHSAAYYHFFTEDRRVIMSYCAVDEETKEKFSPGQKITAIYDPARPSRHVVNDRLWAVRRAA